MAKKQQARKSSTKKSPARAASAVKAKAAPKGKASKSLTPAKNAKYVYLFGSKTDGNGSMKPLLGGKGANLAEMCRIGLPVPPGFTITHRGLHLLLRQQADLSADAARRDGARHRRPRAADRQEVRGSEGPAAGVGALRRPRLDAGHDGHDPQPRPQRPDRRRRWPRRPATRGSPGTAIAASCRCTATSSSACRSVRMRITTRSRR